MENFKNLAGILVLILAIPVLIIGLILLDIKAIRSMCNEQGLN